MGVPAWASDIFTAKEWKAFVKDVMFPIRERDKKAKLDEEAGMVELTVDGEPMTLHLVNVAHQYAQEHDDVFHLLEDWVEAIITELKLAKQLDKLSWDQVAPMLRAQLYAPDQIAPESPLVRELAEELVMTVVVDHEASIISITEKLFASWSQTKDAVFERAIANTRDDTIKLDRRDKDIPEPISLCTGESPYHAAEAYLNLATLAQGKHGTLVMFPSRHGLVFLPISKNVSREMLDNYINGGFVMYEDTPKPLSNLLYTYADGRLAAVPVADGDESFEVDLPPHLAKHIVD